MGKFFTSFKERWVHHGQRVQVYRNLNKPGTTYSIRDVKTGLVLGHTKNVLLSNCIFTVNQNGRNRVLTTKKKSIHAYVEGYYVTIQAGDDRVFTEGKLEVRYNPYKNETFLCGEYDQPIRSAGVVYINEDGVFASGF